MVNKNKHPETKDERAVALSNPNHIRIAQRFLGPDGQGEIGTLADQRQ